MPRSPSERSLVFLVAAVQFVNILDFMMVMPLGPDFAVALGIPTSHLGFIGGAYTAAAAVSGLAGAFFLDRFDRRSALAVAMLGLVIGTAMGGFATGLGTLMAARVLAGAFGGPATSLSFSIIADTIPAARRGRATGAVMGAFAVASVLGVPAGLELARRGGWQMPFFAVAGLGLVIAGLSVFLLPSLRGHLDGTAARGGVRESLRELLALLRRTTVLLSYATTAAVMMAGFVLIPNISTYVQYNLGYPRAKLGLLYLCGGVLSFATTRLVGPLVDRLGSFRVGALGAAMILVVTYVGFYSYVPWVPVLGIFMAFMFAMTFRNVAYNTLVTKVPRPAERARFMSLQSAVQHMSAALAAFLAAQLLKEMPDRSLQGIPRVSAISMALTAVVPVLLWVVESRLEVPPVAPGGGAPVA